MSISRTMKFMVRGKSTILSFIMDLKTKPSQLATYMLLSMVSSFIAEIFLNSHIYIKPSCYPTTNHVIFLEKIVLNCSRCQTVFGAIIAKASFNIIKTKNKINESTVAH